MFDICNWTFKEEGDYSTLSCGTYESDPGEEDFLRFVNMWFVNNSDEKYVHVYCVIFMKFFLAYFTKMYYLCIEFEKETYGNYCH